MPQKDVHNADKTWKTNDEKSCDSSLYCLGIFSVMGVFGAAAVFGYYEMGFCFAFAFFMLLLLLLLCAMKIIFLKSRKE